MNWLVFSLVLILTIWGSGCGIYVGPKIYDTAPLKKADCTEYFYSCASWLPAENGLNGYDMIPCELGDGWCPHYFFAKCRGKKTKNIYKIVWKIENGKAIFLPLELKYEPKNRLSKKRENTWLLNIPYTDSQFKPSLSKENLNMLEICKGLNANSCESFKTNSTLVNTNRDICVYKYQIQFFIHFQFEFNLESNEKALLSIPFNAMEKEITMTIKNPVEIFAVN